MRSVSEQPSAAGVADQLHGKISEKLASAVWIRPVGRLSGYFTRVAAVSNCPFSHHSRAHTRGEPPVPASVFVYVTATARGRVTHQPAVCFSVTLLR